MSGEWLLISLAFSIEGKVQRLVGSSQCNFSGSGTYLSSASRFVDAAPDGKAMEISPATRGT